MTNTRIRVGVCGAAGRMGQAVLKAVLEASDMTLVFAVDHHRLGDTAAHVAGLSETLSDVTLESDLPTCLKCTAPQVVIDFTSPHSVFENATQILETGARAVIGTTGLSEAQRQTLNQLAQTHQSAILVAPNFALGAVLLMKFAQEASRYFDHAEIIELHHNRKLDAPSGTALNTASLMEAVQAKFGHSNLADNQETELLPGARGAKTAGNLRIHSVRLPGLIAHQEVIFGALGETLTLRHDGMDRIAFMPGVLLGIRRILDAQGLIYGLEHFL